MTDPTNDNAEKLAHWVAYDFIAQLKHRAQAKGWSRKDLASKLGLSESRVSQVFHHPPNLTQRTMCEYARALGLGLSVVLYDDDGSSEPIGAEVFRAAWEKLGKPVATATGGSRAKGAIEDAASRRRNRIEALKRQLVEIEALRGAIDTREDS